MTDVERVRYLRIALFVFGLFFIFGIWPLSQVWHSGWSWHEGGRSHYFEMILGIYATLGVFLILASREPMAHASLIWFTVWSSVVHGAIMGVQALGDPQQTGHLWGDVPALFIAAIILAVLMPRRRSGSVPELNAS
jgi:hypothetical protein